MTDRAKAIEEGHEETDTSRLQWVLERCREALPGVEIDSACEGVSRLSCALIEARQPAGSGRELPFAWRRVLSDCYTLCNGIENANASDHPVMRDYQRKAGEMRDLLMPLMVDGEAQPTPQQDCGHWSGEVEQPEPDDVEGLDDLANRLMDEGVQVLRENALRRGADSFYCEDWDEITEEYREHWRAKARFVLRHTRACSRKAAEATRAYLQDAWPDPVLSKEDVGQTAVEKGMAAACGPATEVEPCPSVYDGPLEWRDSPEGMRKCLRNRNEWLWWFVRRETPGASGELTHYLSRYAAEQEGR